MAELGREINSFIRAVANAYQEKDVAFFQKRYLNFNEQVAAGIRDSPSKRVEIAVLDIQFVDDNHAHVSVRRIDTFAEARIPPGVRNLLYELVRSDDGWKIASMKSR